MNQNHGKKKVCACDNWQAQSHATIDIHNVNAPNAIMVCNKTMQNLISAKRDTQFVLV